MEIQDLRSQIIWHPDTNYRYKARPLSSINKIVLHCDDAGSTIQAINRYDIGPNHISDRGCPSFTYHYFVDKSGIVSYCMDDKWCTWHAGDHNWVSLGVCMSYKATNATLPPPTIQLEATTQLLASLCLKHYIDPDNVLGHRELIGTGYNIINGIKKLRKECPGLLTSMSIIRYNTAKIVQAELARLGLYLGIIDGSFGPKSETALAQYKQLKEAGKVG